MPQIIRVAVYKTTNGGKSWSASSKGFSGSTMNESESKHESHVGPFGSAPSPPGLGLFSPRLAGQDGVLATSRSNDKEETLP